MTISLSDFDTKYQNQNTFVPTPTPDIETLPDYNHQASTKIGRLPPRANSLLNNEQNKKFNSQNQLSYNGEVIELFCSTGFDCGNGVCLSSEKVKKKMQSTRNEL